MAELRGLVSSFLILTAFLALFYLGSARQSKTEVHIRLKLEQIPQLEVKYKHRTGDDREQ
jgi:hypothetical protein